MIYSKYFFSVVLFISNIIIVFANNSNIDSLQTELKKSVSIEEQIEIRLSIATIYRKLDLDSTKKYASKALVNSKAINNQILQIKSYFTLAAGYSNNRLLDSSLMFIDSAEYFSKQIDYLPGIAKGNFFRGSSFLFKKNYKESAKHLIKALDEYTMLNDTEYIAQVKHVISYYYITVEDYPKALQYGLESKRIFEELNLYEEQIYSLNNLGIIYNHMHDTIKTIKTWKQCYNLTRQHGQLDDQLRGLNLLANNFYLINQIDSAKYYYLEAVNFKDFPYKEKILLSSYRNLGMIYYKQNNYQNAKKYALTSLKLSRKYHDKKFELRCLEDLSEIYDKMADYKNSLKYLQEYVALKDSLTSNSAGYLLEKTVSDKKLSQKIDELQTLKKQQSTMGRKNPLLISLAVLIFLFFYFYWYYQRRIFFGVKNSIHPDKQTQNDSNFWRYAFPKSPPKQWQIILSALIFSILVFGLQYFFIEKFELKFPELSGALIPGLAFYLAYNGVSAFQRKIENFTLRKEFHQSLMANAIFIIILSTTLPLLFKYPYTPKNILLNVLTILPSCFFSLLILGLLTLRENYNLLFGSLISKLNKQLISYSELLKIKTNLHKSPSCINIENEDLNLDKVIYIVSENVYQEFVYIKNGKINKKLTRKTLKAIEKELEPYPNFIRCHRSYIINLKNVSEIKGNSRQQYLITDYTKEKISISRLQATQILSRFEAINKN